MRILTLITVCLSFGSVYASDPLPSWNQGKAKQQVVQFVQHSIAVGGEKHIPVEQRIAVFDNDGTLWSEQPVYFQLYYAIDRVKALAVEHPEWKSQQPFQAVIEGDKQALIASGKEGLLKLVMATHAGMTTEEFSSSVREWLKTARHPQTNRPYTEMVYQPMLELLEYLRDNEFRTYIVSGGGIDFLRVWAEEAYGIPPHQVFGSSVKVKYEERDGKPVLIRLPELNFIDDKAGKPVGIHQFIGRIPVAAFGNSDGDFEMLKWSARNPYSLQVLIHHTDAQREWAYDRNSHIGKLDLAFDYALKNQWSVVDMKNDWKVIFKSETK